MYIKFFKKFFVLSSFFILLTSCDGNDCIEADDFGEYDTNILTVEAKSDACEWTDDDTGGSGSDTVAECLQATTRSTTISFGGTCDVKLSSTVYSSIKDCLVNTDTSCVDDFEYTGDDCDTSKLSTSDKTNILTSAYNYCIDECINSCIGDSYASDNAFEPTWASSVSASDSSENGISISSAQTITVQVLGALSLVENEDKTKTFSSAVTSKKVQMIPNESGSTYFYSTDSISPVLTGKWCKNGDIGSCQSAYQVGEFGTTANITARKDFLRRGVVVLNDLPNGGTLSSDGTYTGPDQEINYSYWKCTYDSTSSTTTCATNYPDTDSYKTQNDTNYAMDNSFVKTLGGTVVPENASSFILNNPFSNVTCSTKNSERVCYVTGSNTNLVSTGSVTINTSGLGSTPYFLGVDGGIRKVTINSVYPIKLAFAMIDGDGSITKDSSGNNTNACMVNVSMVGSTAVYSTEVLPNGNWFFPTDSENSIPVFNKSDYNTLTKSGVNQDLTTSNNIFQVVVNTDSSQTWTDGSGNAIPCGEGMAVFILPQNEILVNKSGFVSFKNLLGDFVSCPDSDDITGCAAVSSSSSTTNYPLNFDIINPMYDKRDSTSYSTLVANNFYEYLDNENNSDTKSATVTTGEWSSDTFVRKGQILRFDENNWFNISGDNTTGYAINKKYVRHLQDSSFIYNSTGDGLAMRIEARPALLCSGTAEEEIDNPECTQIYNSSGNVTCQTKTYSDLCTTSESTNYCPVGCYCNKSDVEDGICKTATYISSADSTASCVYFEGANATSCTNCQSSVDSVATIEAKIETSLTQCYNLESYTGATRNLTNLANTSLKSSDVATYGELTNNDYDLGARKLDSIFNNGTYGNLDGMELDSSYKTDTSTYSEFRYNSPAKITATDKNISFFVIENENFDTDFTSVDNGTTSNSNGIYRNNTGSYKLTISPEDTFTNGEQLAVALALKDWDGTENSSSLKKWIVKYDMDKTSDSYGSLDSTNSPYYFDSNGYIINSTTKTSKISVEDLGITGLNSDEYENLRLYFKIIDKPEEVACNSSYAKVAYTESLCRCSNKADTDANYGSCTDIDCGSYDIVTKTVNHCVNSYYNNSGSYTIKLKTPKDVLNSTGYIVKYVMEPIMELIDGKTIGLAVDNNGDLRYCSYTKENKSYCSIYTPESEFDPNQTDYGNSCTFESDGTRCYNNCSSLTTDQYKTNCKYFNNGGGFLQRFYTAVVTDNAYQVILKLCFTLMITFYGLYYLLGMADLTHGELIRRLIKISFIYLMVGEEGWKFYNAYFVHFFKQGFDYIVFAVAGSFDDSSSLTEAFVKGNFYDKSVLFSGVDKNLSLLFSDQVSYKIWGLFFVSFFGWLYVFIIYMSIFTYIFSVANAMLLYLTAQFFLSLLLAFGPIFFILMIFEKTKEMFNKWLNNLISFALEQVFLLTCLSLFNILVYNIIKYILSYRVCWKPIWTMNLPILGTLELMSFWKATTATSSSAAASAVPGLFQILLIYLVADLMSKFIEFSTTLGQSIGGSGVYLHSLASDIKKAGGQFYDNRIAKPMKGAATDAIRGAGKKFIGYKTDEEEKKEDANSKVLRKGLVKANVEADNALAQYKKTHGKELLAMTAQERNDVLADVRFGAFKEVFNNDEQLKAAAKTVGIKTAEEFATKKDKSFQTVRSLTGLIGKHTGVRSVPTGAIAKSVVNSRDMRVGAFETAEETKAKMSAGETKDSTYSNFGLPKMGGLMPKVFRSEVDKTAEYDYRLSKKGSRIQHGIGFVKNLFKKDSDITDRYSEYHEEKKKLQETREAEKQGLKGLGSKNVGSGNTQPNVNNPAINPGGNNNLGGTGGKKVDLGQPSTSNTSTDLTPPIVINSGGTGDPDEKK